MRINMKGTNCITDANMKPGLCAGCIDRYRRRVHNRNVRRHHAMMRKRGR